MTLLNGILGTAACHVVYIVEAIPIEVLILVEFLTSFSPAEGCPSCLFFILAVVVAILHIGIGRQAAVVVRTRVCRIIPVKGGATVPSGTENEACAECEVLGRGQVILCQEHWLEAPLYAGVAHLAVLVTPVAVVHIVPHKVIDLLGAGILTSALGRSCKHSEGQLLVVIEVLLRSGIDRKGLVVNTLNPIVTSETAADIDSIGPAVVKYTTGIVGHETEPVHCRVAEDGESPARTHAGRNGVDIGYSVETARSYIHTVKSVGSILAAHCLIESTPKGIWRITGKGIIHRHACKINLLCLGIVAAVLVAYGTEAVAYHIGERVIGIEKDGRRIRVSGIEEVLLSKRRIVECRVKSSDSGHCDKHNVTHEAFLDLDEDILLEEAFRIDAKLVAAIFKPFE